MLTMFMSFNNPYDLCIVGAGLIGSSIARHASAVHGYRVCLIGPPEPKTITNKTSQDVFGAHYDEGRTTRTVDLDPVWSHLSRKSQAHYRELEAKSGVHFYSQHGCLYVGDSSTQEQLRKYSPDHVQYHGHSDLLQKYPNIYLGEKDTGLLNFVGGVVNPRRQADAALVMALKNGCDVIRDVVSVVFKKESATGTVMVVQTEGGKTIYAKRVVLATNVFTQSRRLLPDNVKLKFELMPQTVVFAEVDSEDLEKLKDMPCIIYWGWGSPNWCQDFPRNPDGRIKYYMLPPIPYPDGKFYIKIGHSDFIVKSPLRQEDISKWYHGRGDPWLIKHLTNLTKSMFTGIDFKSFHSDSCVTMVTPTGRPYIQKIHDQLGVAIGGNGHAAKCCDEIGRIAVDMMMSETWNYKLPQKTFEVIFENENESVSMKSKL